MLKLKNLQADNSTQLNSNHFVVINKDAYWIYALRAPAHVNSIEAHLWAYVPTNLFEFDTSDSHI